VGTVSDCGVLQVDSGVKVLTGRGQRWPIAAGCRRRVGAQNGLDENIPRLAITKYHKVCWMNRKLSIATEFCYFNYQLVQALIITFHSILLSGPVRSPPPEKLGKFGAPITKVTWLLLDRLIDWVVFLRPTRHKTHHFGDVSPSQSLGSEWKKTKPNSTKSRIRQSKEMYCNTK